jgi:hypothetical protein
MSLQAMTKGKYSASMPVRLPQVTHFTEVILFQIARQ